MHTSVKLKVLIIAVVVTTGIAVAVVAAWYHDYPVRHFGVVQEGVLYRSAQPDRHGWERLRDLYGMRTVIDLTEDAPDESSAVLERRFCQESGIRYVKLPIGPDRLTDEELRIVVETISDPKCQPVLVHCELGKSRTGVVVAAYRIVAQRWCYEAALAESEQYKQHMEPGHAAYIKELAEGKRWRPSINGSAVGLGERKRYP